MLDVSAGDQERRGKFIRFDFKLVVTNKSRRGIVALSRDQQFSVRLDEVVTEFVSYRKANSLAIGRVVWIGMINDKAGRFAEEFNPSVKSLTLFDGD